MLEQFTPVQSQSQGPKSPPPSASSVPASSSSPAPAAPASSTSAGKAKGPATTLDDLDMSDDFARELAEGMASLMREIAGESSSAAPDAKADGKKADVPSTDEEPTRDEAFRKAWEAMMIEGMEGKPETGKGPSAGGVEDGFQDSIKRAMERMRESEQGLHVRSHFCVPVLGVDYRVAGRFDTRRR